MLESIPSQPNDVRPDHCGNDLNGTKCIDQLVTEITPPRESERIMGYPVT
jgi:hypothetical protein